MKAKQIMYEGKVQGVGFRYTVKQIATGFDVCGSVRNLQDGRVELKVEGEAEEVDEFLEEIRQSSLAGHILREEVLNLQETLGLKGFQIIA